MNLFFRFIFFVVFFLFFSCIKENQPVTDIDRGHDPWVFRSVLDKRPRMLTIALHDNLWISYSTQYGSLYKAWKGGVNFKGAVYNAQHGPQPTSFGDVFFVNAHFETPWSIKTSDGQNEVSVQYAGHRFVNGQVELMYTLPWNGIKIEITERPEIILNENGTVGFERVFATKNVPVGAEVLFATNINSVISKEVIETDGDFTVKTEEKQTFKNILSSKIDGVLTLNANSTTRLYFPFVKNPVIPDPNQKGVDYEFSVPLGARLIAKNDCKTCHNIALKTIGPSYQDVASKYANTKENTNYLIQKIKTGGSGVWGVSVMNPHPDLPETNIRTIVKYIMGLDADEETDNSAYTKTSASATDPLPALEGIAMEDLFAGAFAVIRQHNKELSYLKDIDWSVDPVYAGVVPEINIEGSDFKTLESRFSVLTEGYLRIPADGSYGFQVRSDDGSKLYIDGDEVIDYDGTHGAGARNILLSMKAGIHSFRLEYFQNLGGKALIFEWKPPGSIGYVMIPQTILLHRISEREKWKDKSMPLGIISCIPGDGYPLEEVHPSYDLRSARPPDFSPKVGGMDFTDDGQLVLCTWDPSGAVYLLSGVQSGDPGQIEATRIAYGLAEPLGLKVVDGDIYVLQKQELTRLVDTNGDGIMDEYQTVSNDWRVSDNFHEFAFGLEYKDGFFYAALATSIDPGGASSVPQIADRGKAVKISKEDGSVEFVAHGLRTPNGIGIGVDNEIFIADNQGDWLPSSKIVHVKTNAWYGSRSVDYPGTENLEETLPVVWLPQDEIGNSPSTPSYINDGPYAGQMIHGEVTHGGVKRVFVEKINGQYQGCVFRFIQGLEAGINRLVWGPDGALYVGGIGSTGNWGHTGKLWYGLQRLKYNGKSTFEMLAVRAKSNGIEIEFTEPLKEGEGWRPGDYLVKQWRYQPTENYGGPKMDEKILRVASVNLSDDRRRVFLELEGMEEQYIVVYIQLQNHFISEHGGELWSTEAWYTMNQIPENEPGINTTQTIYSVPNTLTAGEEKEGWQLLFDGKTFNGWKGYRREFVPGVWIIEDGAMTMETISRPGGGRYIPGNNDIITTGEFENFELYLEWKIQDCGNSGIFWPVKELEDYNEAYFSAIEMQVLDNKCHPDGREKTHRAGDIYDLIECKYVTVKPANQWNKVRWISNNGKIEHWLNGHKVIEYELWADEWNEMVENSKFRDWPFAKTRSGHIGLQDHDDQVWFRNIKVREL